MWISKVKSQSLGTDVRSSVHKMIDAGLINNPGESMLSKWNIHFLQERPIVLARSQHQIFKSGGQMD